MQSRSRSNHKVPQGLVGSRCTAEITINGQKSFCLLDTGSQVTTIPVTFYTNHLSDLPVQSLEDLIQVEGALVKMFHILATCKLLLSFQKILLGAPSLSQL